MMDVHAAIAWSRERLKPGGFLVMNDYVGPSRFQYDENTLTMCNTILADFNMPPACRPDAKVVEKSDPTEAADSGRIKDALFRYFPDALWIPTGGILYFIGFCFKEVDWTPDALMKMIELDARLNAAGNYVYAFAVAKRT